MLFPILTIVGGLIAASSFLIAKKPDAKQLFEKVAPYQGFLGIGMLVLGIFWLLRILPALDTLLRAAPMTGVLTLAALAANILIGFVLGYGLLAKFVLSKNEVAKERGAVVLAKLAKIQVPLGLVAVALGGTLMVF